MHLRRRLERPETHRRGPTKGPQNGQFAAWCTALHALSSRLVVFFVCACLFAGCASTRSPATRPTLRGPAAPEIDPSTLVVFVPGVTGSMLVDTQQHVRWLTGRRLLFPRDRGHSLALALDAEARELEFDVRAEGVVERVRLFGFERPIYAPLIERFERAGFRITGTGTSNEPQPETTEGEAHNVPRFHAFSYDWRQSNLVTVNKLHTVLEELGDAYSGERDIVLLCQSNAGKVCRYLVKYGPLSLDEAEQARTPPRPGYRISKVILAGTSNGGSLRMLRELNRGRRYIRFIGRHIGPETMFTLRPLFEDLPDTNDLFVDESGAQLEVELFEAESWARYGWSVFSPGVERRIERMSRKRRKIFLDREGRLAYVEQRLDIAKRWQALLDVDSSFFDEKTRFYLIDNASARTYRRAVLTPRGGDPARGWRTRFFDDRAVRKNQSLVERTSELGDGHATLDSQRRLSVQERNALAEPPIAASGGHFEMLIQPETLDLLIELVSR